MSKDKIQIIDENLSMAWAKAFLASMKTGVEEISPLTITITGFKESTPVELPEIRYALNLTLADCEQFSVETTAGTIFPQSLWNPQMEAQTLYDRYKRVLPALKKAQSQNRYGLYFERLISFGEGERNQLDYIIETYKRGNHRRSALQATVFNPLQDQTDQRQRGFPCLQQIAFIPSQGTRELSIHAFYATQYLFNRAYGNLLGLARLAYFVAHELELQFSQLSCTAAVAKYGDVSKRRLNDLASMLNPMVT